jgi:protein O-mannosyl-transferase
MNLKHVTAVQNNFRTDVFVMILLTLTGFLFYSNSLTNGYALDDAYILDTIKSRDSLRQIFHLFLEPFNRIDYRPVSLFTFALERYITGSENPQLSHLINLWLYITTAFLIYLTVKKLPVHYSFNLGLLTALLFIAHPVHSSMVNNLKNRDGILSMLFTISSLYFFISYFTHYRKRHLLFAAFFLVIASISKMDSIGLLVILPLTRFIFFPVQVQQIKKYAVMLLAIVLLFFTTSLIIDYFVQPEKLTNQQNILFTENPLIANNTLLNRIAAGGMTYWIYLKFMLKPWGYYFYFGYDTVTFPPVASLTFILLLTVHLLLGLTFIYYLKKNKIVSYSIAFFYGTLFYCSNLYVLVGGIVADRYAYIASFGFCLLVAEGLIRTAQNKTVKTYLAEPGKRLDLMQRITPERMVYVLLLLILLIYLPFVRARNADWKNMETLLQKDMPHLTRSFEANRIATTYYINEAFKTPYPKDKEEYFLKALGYSKFALKLYDEDIYTNESELIAYYGLENYPEAEKKIRFIIQQFDTSAVAWDLLGDLTFRRSSMTVLCRAILK